eukprot:XP_001693161.1 predicted protein [Chlamydomonas reinhardtii]
MANANHNAKGPVMAEEDPDEDMINSQQARRPDGTPSSKRSAIRVRITGPRTGGDGNTGGLSGGQEPQNA